MITRHISAAQRLNFRRIMMQLDKTKSEKMILKIIEQATKFLHDHDVDWDVATVRVPDDYVLRSQRKKKASAAVMDKMAAARAAKVVNGALGRDGRALLKTAVTRHPDWPVIKETLGVDISRILIDDLVAIAQLMKLDQKFIAMFAGQKDVTSPAQGDLPLNGTGDDNSAE